jgi:hypothetical protein
VHQIAFAVLESSKTQAFSSESFRRLLSANSRHPLADIPQAPGAFRSYDSLLEVFSLQLA